MRMRPLINSSNVEGSFGGWGELSDYGGICGDWPWMALLK